MNKYINIGSSGFCHKNPVCAFAFSIVGSCIYSSDCDKVRLEIVKVLKVFVFYADETKQHERLLVDLSY